MHRNCHNRRNLKETLVLKESWHEISVKTPSVLKMGDLKFYECPVSVITKQTWGVIGLVNESTDGDGNILHLPFEGALLDQPNWFRTAVKIVKSERANHQRERIQRGKK